MMTAIEIIGHDQVRSFGNNDYVLNQGSVRWCEDSSNSETSYCEFENYFREDLSLALQCSATNVELLFIKPSGEGSVFMTFRLIPPESVYLYNTSWVESKANLLDVFVSSHQSQVGTIIKLISILFSIFKAGSISKFSFYPICITYLYNSDPRLRIKVV